MTSEKGTGGSTGTGSGNTTIDQFTCMDHDTRCSLFSAQICSPTVSHDYVVSTCAKTCNLCTEYLASLKGTKKVKCMVCGDNDQGIPCSLKEVYENVTTIMECPQGSDYCMTDMHVDGSRNQDVFKRCVTRDVCEQKWIQESADLDYCNKYGQVSNPNPHECHFCCTGEACNSMVKPSDQTLVPKSK